MVRHADSVENVDNFVFFPYFDFDNIPLNVTKRRRFSIRLSCFLALVLNILAEIFNFYDT